MTSYLTHSRVFTVSTLNKVDTMSDTLSPSQERFNQAVELEKQLRSVIQSKGPLDTIVQNLHSHIRKNYETIIIEDQEFADFHDVEQALWRFHYKQIEEFRIRIRNSMVGAAVNSMPASKSLSQKESVKMLLTSFKSFLSEATEFYNDLISKLREKQRLPKEVLLTKRIDFTNDKKGDTELKRCQLSCHRCLIYLGDLARYKELHGDMDVRKRDWFVAADYYLKAIFLWPASGNPHNQLAVLATYIGDDLLAVYRYFRSLAVDNPFLTARDNLILLFEKNRQQYDQDSSTKFRMIDAVKMTRKERMKDGKLDVKDNKQQSTEENLKSLQIIEMKTSFCVHFVRLHGILFTKTSLETFPEVYDSTMRELESLLSLDDTGLEAGLGTYRHKGIIAGSNAAIGAVQLVCILIFTVHNIICSNNIHQSKYDEASQPCALLQHAFTAAFECSGHLVQRCLESKDVLTSPLLSAMLVFMEWLACTPKIVEASEIDEKQANAREFFWKQSVMLLNKLWEGENSDTKVNTCLGASVGFNAHDGIAAENEFHIALWEDYELQGFAPLVAAQMQLNYSPSPLQLDMQEKRELKVRVQRILAAGMAIVKTWNDTGRWIDYNETTKKFCLAGKILENENTELRLSDKKLTDEVDVKNHVHVGQNNGQLLEISEHKYAGLTDACATQTNNEKQVLAKDISVTSVDIEEDDEVIVYKPVQKEISVNTSACRQRGDLYFGTSNSIFSEMTYALPNSYIPDKFIISEGPNYLTCGINNEQSHIVSLPLEQWQFSNCTYPDSLWEATIQRDQTDLAPKRPPIQEGSEFSTSAFSSMPSYSDVQDSLGMSSVGMTSSMQEDDPEGNCLNFKNTDSILFLKDWLSKIASLSSHFRSSSSSSWDIQNDSMTVDGSVMPNSIGDIQEQKQAGLGDSMLNTEMEALSLGNLSNSSNRVPALSHHMGNNSSVPVNFNMDFSSEMTNTESQSITSNFLMDSFSIVPSVKEYTGVPYPSAPLLPNDDLNSEPGTAASTQILNCSGVAERDDFDAGIKNLDFSCSMPHDYVSSKNGHSDLFSLDVTNEKLGTCWMGPSSRGPPSGFGSHASKLEKGRLHATPRPVCQVVRSLDMEDPLQLDNSAWPDAYTCSKFERNNQKYHDGEFSLYSSDYDSWSNASSRTASLDDRGFPFQGLGVSQFYQTDEQHQRNLLLMQLSQKLLQEQQETKRFGYDVEPQTLPFESLQSVYEHHQSHSQQQLHFLQQLKQQEWCMQHGTHGPAS